MFKKLSANSLRFLNAVTFFLENAITYVINREGQHYEKGLNSQTDRSGACRNEYLYALHVRRGRSRQSRCHLEQNKEQYLGNQRGALCNHQQSESIQNYGREYQADRSVI